MGLIQKKGFRMLLRILTHKTYNVIHIVCASPVNVVRNGGSYFFR